MLLILKFSNSCSEYDLFILRIVDKFLFINQGVWMWICMHHFFSHTLEEFINDVFDFRTPVMDVTTYTLNVFYIFFMMFQWQIAFHVKKIYSKMLFYYFDYKEREFLRSYIKKIFVKIQIRINPRVLISFFGKESLETPLMRISFFYYYSVMIGCNISQLM